MNTLPDIKEKMLVERDDMDLLELVCQLHSRALNIFTKEMHDAYVAARAELEKRLYVYAKAYAPVSENDMTAELFYNSGLFNLDFMTAEERQTIYTATELYAKGKLRQAVPGKEEIERLILDCMEEIEGLCNGYTVFKADTLRGYLKAKKYLASSSPTVDEDKKEVINSFIQDEYWKDIISEVGSNKSGIIDLIGELKLKFKITKTNG